MLESITHQRLAIAGAAAAAFWLGYSFGSSTGNPRASIHRTVPSPRTTLIPYLSTEQARALPYPPNFLPGSRDVKTPYGVMRVYEWGPEEGRKVVFIHGDATPAPIFGPIGHALVAIGCRVMLIDSWGKGYSDDPADCPHDARLYGLQILFAISTSAVSWTGNKSNGFSLVGFSLGGPIVMDFFNHFPDLVSSIVLLGPAGLIRQLPASYRNPRFRYPLLYSRAYMRTLIATALGIDKTVFELPDAATVNPTTTFDAEAVEKFQLEHHHGNQDSWLSTLQQGPVQNQVDIWRRTGDIVSGVTKAATPLCGSRILVICGDNDTVIPAEDIEEDLVRYFKGPKHFQLERVPGGHGFTYPNSAAIAKLIAGFWGIS